MKARDKQRGVKGREQRRKEIAIPQTFVPKFLDDLDQRCGITKEIKRRYETLVEDTGADSYQQEMLCQRAIFVGVQLETMECMAAESGKFDPGIYTQMTNSLLGLLKALGLDRKIKDAASLKTYMEECNA